MHCVVLADSWGLVWDQTYKDSMSRPHDHSSSWCKPQPGFWTVLRRYGYTLDSIQVAGGTSNCDQVDYLKCAKPASTDLLIVIQTDPIRDVVSRISDRQRDTIQSRIHQLPKQLRDSVTKYGCEALLLHNLFERFEGPEQFFAWQEARLKEHYQNLHEQLPKWGSPRVVFLGGVSPVRPDLWPRGVENWSVLAEHWPKQLGIQDPAQTGLSMFTYAVTDLLSRPFIEWFWEELGRAEQYAHNKHFRPDPGHPNSRAHRAMSQLLLEHLEIASSKKL